MSRLQLLTCLAVLPAVIVIPPLRADTEVSGGVRGLWRAADSPYIATDDLVVADDDTLAIEAGVEVRFDEGVRMAVYGLLLASGDEGDSIRFLPGGGAATSSLPAARRASATAASAAGSESSTAEALRRLEASRVSATAL